jgi:hypothetical protein
MNDVKRVAYSTIAAVVPSVGWKLKAIKSTKSKQDESSKRQAPDEFEGWYLTVILQFSCL